MQDESLDREQIVEVRDNKEISLSEALSESKILKNPNKNILKNLKFKLGIPLIAIILLVIGFAYQGLHTHYANKSFNAAISSLRSGDLDSAYQHFIDTSKAFANTKAGSLSKQYADKIDKVKQLSTNITSTSNDISSKRKFIEGSLKTIGDYLETANLQMSNAENIPMNEIAQDSVWANQSIRYANFADNLSVADQQYLSSQDYDIIKSAFACYTLAQHDMAQFFTLPDFSDVNDFNKEVDLFNNDNYPYVHNLINDLKSNFDQEQSDLNNMNSEFQNLKHDLDSASKL